MRSIPGTHTAPTHPDRHPSRLPAPRTDLCMAPSGPGTHAPLSRLPPRLSPTCRRHRSAARPRGRRRRPGARRRRSPWCCRRPSPPPSLGGAASAPAPPPGPAFRAAAPPRGRPHGGPEGRLPLPGARPTDPRPPGSLSGALGHGLWQDGAQPSRRAGTARLRSPRCGRAALRLQTTFKVSACRERRQKCWREV